MVYITNVDDYSIKFSDSSGTYTEIKPKTLRARKDENDRVWIEDYRKNEAAVVSQPNAELSLDGVIHTSASVFVQAFNSLMENATFTTTTTTTVAVTTTTTAA